jgi:YVTN family beta-propeller protein
MSRRTAPSYGFPWRLAEPWRHWGVKSVAAADGITHLDTNYLLASQRLWYMAFTPDKKYLLTTNGVSNDVSIIAAPALKVIIAIQVGPSLGALRCLIAAPDGDCRRRRAHQGADDEIPGTPLEYMCSGRAAALAGGR